MKSEAFLAFLHDEFHREQGTGFARLNRIPSTSARKFIDYFATLDEHGKTALADAFAKKALLLFVRTAQHPSKMENEAYQQYRNSMALKCGWKYTKFRLLKPYLAELDQTASELRTSFGVTPEVLTMLQSIQPVQAKEIKPLVKLALLQMCPGLAITNKGGGLWQYAGAKQGIEFRFTVDYAGRADQLRYEIDIQDQKNGIIIERLSFEAVMGLSFAAWDCLEKNNLDQSIALLKELIIYCLELPARLPQSIK
jgi:hypothetical protein